MMNGRIKKILFAAVCCALLVLPHQRGECFVTLKFQDVPLGFAAMKLPQEAYISKYNIISFAEKFLGIGYRGVNKNDRKLLENIRVYQLAIDDGQHYRTALFVSATDTKRDSSREMAGYLSAPPTEVEKQEILREQGELRREMAENIQKVRDFFAQLKKEGKMTELAFGNISIFNAPSPHLLSFEMPDVEFFTLGGRPAYAGSIRGLAEWNGIFFLGYGKGYLFSCDGRMTGCAFFTTDSDREFWTDIFDQAVYRLPLGEE